MCALICITYPLLSRAQQCSALLISGVNVEIWGRVSELRRSHEKVKCEMLVESIIKTDI